MLLENYCSRLGSLVEHRYSSLALLEAKQQAEEAAIVAHEAMLKAKAADRAKSKFLANMAHELHTPLNAIIGFSEIIKLNNIQTRERYPEYGQYIHDAGSNLLDILNGILDLARIESGSVDLQEELTPFYTVVQSAINSTRPFTHGKSIDIKCAMEDLSIMVYLDPNKLKQIIQNLLSNAVKFTEPRGHIHIHSVLQDCGDLLLSIRDTGIGIPPEQVEKVFQPFEQVADHLTRQHQGTGLGLPIAKALVELHGGELVLSSEVGVGTVARLQLPADRVRSIPASVTTRVADDRPQAGRGQGYPQYQP